MSYRAYRIIKIGIKRHRFACYLHIQYSIS
jgi:hypothetical protein